MHTALLAVMGIASFWDAFTTLYGTYKILGDGGGGLIAAVIFGVLIPALLINTRRITSLEDNFEGQLLRGLLFVALFYDLITSWMGNNQFIVDGAESFPQHILLIGLTVLVSGAPMALSFLMAASPEQWRAGA